MDLVATVRESPNSFDSSLPAITALVLQSFIVLVGPAGSTAHSPAAGTRDLQGKTDHAVRILHPQWRLEGNQGGAFVRLATDSRIVDVVSIVTTLGNNYTLRRFIRQSVITLDRLD